MRRVLVVLPLVAIVLTLVSASAALLDLGSTVAQAFRYNVSVGPIGHCKDLPADTVCIEVPPPSAPSALGCDVDLHAFAATLSWDAVPGADQYDIYHGVLWIGPEHLDTVPGGQTDYGLRPALLRHRYQVTASHIGGESAPSATIAVHCAPWWHGYAGPHALGASSVLDTDGSLDESVVPEGLGGQQGMRLDPVSLALAGRLAPAAPEDDAPEGGVAPDATPEATPEATPPAVDLPLTRTVELSWAQDGRSQVYVVLRGTTPGGPYAEAGYVEGGSFSEEVATSATYYYVVVGVDADGVESDPSEEIVAPGIVLPPVVKAPMPLPSMPECPDADTADESALTAEDGALDGDPVPCAIPTPAPTSTPTPTATPSLTPTPAPSPGPGPSSAPTPPTSTPPSPTAEPTASPTATPDPTPTAEATATPEATPMAEPTPEPTPEPTSEPTPDPTPDAEPTPESTPESEQPPEPDPPVDES